MAGLALLAGPPASAREAQIRAWPAAQATPSLRLSDLEGKLWTLTELRGKVVLINFWASWCEPCVEESAFLAELARRADDKLVILGVNFKESPAQIRQFAAAHPPGYPLLLDPSGDDFRKWSGSILPMTILVDRKGKARWRIIGLLDATDDNFNKTLARLLNE